MSGSLTLTDLLGPGRIVLGQRAVDKAHALQALAALAGTHLPLESGAILAALTAREALGSTGFGHGFALPHVRMDGIDAPFGALVRLAKPIGYGAIDRKPVDVLFLLLFPEGGGSHVAALAAISRSMREGAVLTAVRQAENPASLLAFLAAAERL